MKMLHLHQRDFRDIGQELPLLLIALCTLLGMTLAVVFYAATLQ